MSEYLFEFEGWAVIEKPTKLPNRKAFIIYHNCNFGKEQNVRYGFHYYRNTPSVHYCVFCQTTIPGEVTFLLEMTKR